MSPKILALVLIRTLAVLLAFVGAFELIIFPVVFLFGPVAGISVSASELPAWQYLKSGTFYFIGGLILLRMSGRLAKIVMNGIQEEER